MEDNIHIRWMIRRDMPEVLEMEKLSFEFPWQEKDFLRCLRQRNCIGRVADNKEKVVGFSIYELHKKEIRILNLAVDPTFRRSGVGSAIVEELVAKLSQERRTKVILEVRETNLPAQSFFSELGFRATSIMKDLYDDTTEDAYVMQYRINELDRLTPAHRLKFDNFTPND